MKISDKGLALIKRHEGFRALAYYCPAGVLTIGYGHTTAAGHPTVMPGSRVTEAEAVTILQRDVSRFAEGVMRLVKVPLTQGQYDALISFAFNVGLGALGKSTLLRKLNAGDYAAVPAQLMRWTKAGGKELAGLVRRRRDEAALWRSLDDTATAGKATVPKVDAPKPPKPVTQSKTANGSIIAGAGGAIAAGKEAIDTAKDAAEAASSGWQMAASVGPWVLLAVVIVGACAFIWWDRRRKLIEEGV